jgi:hypothetical protein
MEIAIVTGFFTERDVEINSGHGTNLQQIPAEPINCNS